MRVRKVKSTRISSQNLQSAQSILWTSGPGESPGDEKTWTRWSPMVPSQKSPGDGLQNHIVFCEAHHQQPPGILCENAFIFPQKKWE